MCISFRKGSKIILAIDLIQISPRKVWFGRVLFWLVWFIVGMCFEDTMEGNHLLDFIIGSQNARRTGTMASYMDGFFKRMKELSSKVNGKFIMTNTTKVYIIQKQNE